MTESVDSLIKLRKEANDLKNIEKLDNDNKKTYDHLWVNYGDISAPYENDFGNLIKESKLSEHAKIMAERFRKAGKVFCVFDPFSPLESWLKRVQKRKEDGSLPMDGGVASTLNDPRRDEKVIKADERKGLYCVEGDITLPGPRGKLKECMNKLGIDKEGFGMVIVRPYGGARLEEKEPRYVIVYYALLRQLWEVVSGYDGEIFCPVPESLSKSPEFHKWVEVMKNEVGASIELTPLETNMKITKHQNSKSELPRIKDLQI